jgi:hypothetical protein
VPQKQTFREGQKLNLADLAGRIDAGLYARLLRVVEAEQADPSRVLVHVAVNGRSVSLALWRGDLFSFGRVRTGASKAPVAQRLLFPK